jgi:hypothetical protein
VTCWPRPEDVREGIWRIARLLGDCSIDGDGRAGVGCGVGVPAGESDGDSIDWMSILTMRCRVFLLHSPQSRLVKGVL